MNNQAYCTIARKRLKRSTSLLMFHFIHRKHGVMIRWMKNRWENHLTKEEPLKKASVSLKLHGLGEGRGKDYLWCDLRCAKRAVRKYLPHWLDLELSVSTIRRTLIVFSRKASIKNKCYLWGCGTSVNVSLRMCACSCELEGARVPSARSVGL